MDELRADDPHWIGAYRLLGRLGTGGMGRVFLARSERGRTVAVKLVRAELAEQEEFRTRFRREVQAARRVGGTWTAPVLDADTEADIPWVATGYVAGPSLQQVIKEYGPLPERSVRVLAAGLAHALVDIHAAGLVHRDLKPSNVMITIDGPRVIDFGIARALETVLDGGATLTYTGALVGSPAFMSPEQVRGDRVTPAGDVFCLGSVLAYAVTGLQPFGAASSGVHAQMFRIVQEPPDLGAVPEGLRELVAACLTKEPRERPSPHEVLKRIEDAAADAPDAAEDDAETVGTASAASRVEPWLPGAIVAQLGRQAVQLLELEAEATQPSLPPPAAETAVLVPAARADVAGASGTAAARASGAEVDEAASGADVASASGAGSDAPGAASTGADAPGAGSDVAGAGADLAGADSDHSADSGSSATPPPPPPAPEPSALLAASEPQHTPPARRGRRGVLVAVLALLAVLAGGTTAFVVVHQGGDGHGTGGPQATAPPTATTATSSDTRPPTTTPPPARAGVAAPKGLVGTWRAEFNSAPDATDTRTLTVHRDGSVVLTGHGQKADDSGYDCVWSMQIATAGPPAELTASQVVSGAPAGSCQGGGTTKLTLLDRSHLRRADIGDSKAPLTYKKIS